MYIFLLLGLVFKDPCNMHVIFKKKKEKKTLQRFARKSLENSSDLYRLKQIPAKLNNWLSSDQ